MCNQRAMTAREGLTWCFTCNSEIARVHLFRLVFSSHSLIPSLTSMFVTICHPWVFTESSATFIESLLFIADSLLLYAGDLSSILSLSHYFLSPMVKRPTLFLNLISCKDLRFYNTSNCWFSQNSLLERGETDGQSPVLHGEAMWPPLIPLQAEKCCSNKSPNAPTFFLALSVNPFCFLLFFFMYENAALWLAGCSLPACL